MKNVSDVIIVGAGVSGMSAARLLTKRGFDVVVVEATNRLGGRACTCYPLANEPQYGWADMGGTFVSKSDVNIMTICKELGLNTLDLVECPFNSALYTKGVGYKFIDLRTSLFWWNPFAAWDLAVMVRRLEKMCWEVPVDKPWEAPRAREWDNMTVKQFCDKHCWTKFCNEYLTSVLRTLTASREHHMSLLYYLWEIRLANRRNHMLGWGISPNDDLVLIDGGTQQLSDKMASDLDKAVVLNQPVVSITHTEDGVHMQTLHGQEYQAKYLILATPAVTQMKIHFEPPLTEMRSSLIQRSPMGLVMKCVVFYSQPFWEDSGLNGSVTCMDADEVLGAVDAVNSSKSKLFGLHCLIFQNHMLKFLEMSDEKIQAEVCASLARIFQTNKAFLPVKFIQKSWSTGKGPYESGGFTSYYPPGVLTSYGPAMRTPIGSRVFLAGTDTAIHLRGDLSGAVAAGQRAARQVLHAEGYIAEDEVWIKQLPEKYNVSLMEEMLPSIDLVLKVFLAILATLLGYYCTLLYEDE